MVSCGATRRGQGRIEGTKDRPCAVVLAIRTSAGVEEVTVVPITHSPPRAGQPHVALATQECRLIGLDGGLHWAAIDEVNTFIWPGYDLRLVPGTGRYDYGVLPQGAVRRIVIALVALQRERGGPTRTRRD